MSLSARIVRWVVLTVFTAITLIPLSSFKTNAELFASPFGLPARWSFDNYFAAWNAHPLHLYLRNSISAAGLSAVIVVLASLMASYALMHQFGLNRGFPIAG
jgi:ABC-type glycerol-3-phosphate transport system permease component